MGAVDSSSNTSNNFQSSDFVLSCFSERIVLISCNARLSCSVPVHKGPISLLLPGDNGNSFDEMVETFSMD